LRIEHELPRYGKADIDSLRYFGELLTPYEGDPHSSKESWNSMPIGDADDAQSQSLSSDLLRGSAALDAPLEHSEARVQSGMKATTIDVKSLPLDIEGQPTTPAHMGGARLRDARPGDERLGDTRLGDAHLRDARLGDTRLGDACL